MGDSLRIFNKAYQNVTGVKATNTLDTTLAYIRPEGSISITENGTANVSQYASAIVNVSADGDYIRTLVCPLQNFTIPSGETAVLLSDTSRLVSGDDYIVTFDNVEYVCTSTELWGSDRFLGDLPLTWNNTSSDYIFPFAIEDWNNNPTLGVYARDNSQHSIKIEHLELLTEGTSLVSKTITTNGTYNPASDSADGYSNVVVNVSGSAPSLQSKSATPTESTQTITADSGYDGLSSVEVGAISSTYVGSGITQRSSTDITASGATVTVPSGFYEQAASKSIANGSEGTPTATKGTVSNHSVSITPSVTNTAGYISGGTHSGTPVSVSASELVSGTKSINANGTGIDVTNYASVDVAVPASSPNLQSKSATPTESVQTITADSTYDGLSSVEIGAISSTYVGSGITQRSSSDLTASGATVTVPAGFYETQATKSVATTTHPNPTASINTSTGLITASHTQTAGYVTAGTTTGTTQLTTQAAKTVSPTESEQTAVAANVYTTGIVKVGAISSTYVGSGITRGSSSSVQVNSTNNTISVPVGYYDTAVNKSMAEASINTTTSGVTIDSSNVAHGSLVVSTGGYIAAGTYTTAQGIQIQKYYTGSSDPPSSLGNNGDLYFKVVS